MISLPPMRYHFPPKLAPRRARFGLACCALMCLMALAPLARGHGGVALEDDLCVISIGYLSAHFKIYQPRQSGHKQYCEDIPDTGESVFVMEYAHAGFNEAPIDFRIIRNETGMGQFANLQDLNALGDLERLTVFHRPAEVSTDVYTALYDFGDPGEFIGIVTVTMPGSGDLQTAVFPFEVGYTGLGYWPWFIALALLVQLQYLNSTGRLRRWLRPERSTAVVAAATIFAVVTPCGLFAAESWPSKDGLYRVSYSSELQPLQINRIHQWTLHLVDAAGQPVEGAAISIEGGMPAHDHGLPTQPMVTEDLGGGNYRVEGMRFHMNGQWEVSLSIEAVGLRDTAIIPVQL